MFTYSIGMETISNIEFINFVRSWERITSQKTLPRKAKEAIRIDKEPKGKVKTREEVLAYNRAKSKRSKDRDVNNDRKNFALYIRQAHGMEVEDLAIWYNRQNMQCACGHKIKLNRDYRILPGRIICKICAIDVE